MIELFAEEVPLSETQRAAVLTAAEAALRRENRTGGLSLLVVTPDGIRDANRTFRSVDRVTDVLTFPAWEGEELLSPPDGYLGDIMLCRDRAAEQAAEYGHSIERELGFLAVHGVLHLLGYDHMTEADETVMRNRQTEILEGIGLLR